MTKWGVKFKIAQPSTPLFGYNDSIFSVSNDVYEVSSEKDIQGSVEIGKSIDKSSLKYLYKFKPKRDLESYMVASFSEIYLINGKPLRGKFSDVVLVKYAYDVTYKGKVYEKGKYYIANRTAKHSDYTISE
ncbi:hypothetical protein [Faecalimicrobium dakarense]|uniref:hypothetical protein n=1 Tax=Faecalimicrobium dakarense TaxID=1301100 RepID=UPI0004B103F2|nr:hypothetical protein [[Clostridium] dakarense]